MKKVSVIIPTYKRSDYLGRAIRSVKNQTYNNIEIIIVDDNDSDSKYRKINEEKIAKYKGDNNFIYLRHEKNLNGAAARNTGIKKASGDYITFLDDDDFFLPSRVEELVNILETNREYDGAYSSVAIMKNNSVIDVIHATKNGNLKLDLLKQKSFFGTGSNVFLRASTIKKIGFFDEDFIRHQDIEYMIRFFDHGKILDLDKILVVKCIDDNGNVPNFSKIYEVKKLFFSKFDNDIRSFSKSEIREIYYCNYLEMLYVFCQKKENYKFVKSKLKKFGKVTFKIKAKYYYKKYMNVFPICIIEKIRKRKKEKKCCSNLERKNIMTCSKL